MEQIACSRGVSNLPHCAVVRSAFSETRLLQAVAHRNQVGVTVRVSFYFRIGGQFQVSFRLQATYCDSLSAHLWNRLRPKRRLQVIHQTDGSVHINSRSEKKRPGLNKIVLSRQLKSKKATPKYLCNKFQEYYAKQEKTDFNIKTLSFSPKSKSTLPPDVASIAVLLNRDVRMSILPIRIQYYRNLPNSPNSPKPP